jgi:hypothetical protein
MPLGYSYILDFFKKYAREIGGKAIIGDSIMMIVACLLSSHMATRDVNMNIIALITSLYLYPYNLFLKP